MSFYFGNPVTIVPDLLQYFPTQPTASVTWGLGMIDLAPASNGSGTNLVIGFGNMQSAEEFPVLMFNILASGSYTANSSVLGSLNWPSYAGPIFANDFNGDGVVDVFMPGAAGHNPSDPIGGEVPVLALSTSATQWAAASISIPNAKFYTHSWDMGDVNGDGAKDILLMNNVFHEGNPYPTILINDGLGGFSSHTELLPASVTTEEAYGDSGFYQANFEASELVDIDNDGDLDIVVPETHALFWTDDPAYLPDGVTDGVAVRKIQGQIWLNDGSGHYSVSDNFLPEVEPGNARGLYFATNIESFDVNGDGFADLVYAATPRGVDGRYSNYYSDSLVKVLINNQQGGFYDDSSRIHGSDQTILGAWASDVVLKDAEGDGDIDIFARVVDGIETGVNAWLSRGITLFLNDGIGHFNSVRASQTVFSDIFANNQVVYDINNDGLQDLIFSDHGSAWTGSQYKGAIQVAYGEFVVDAGTAGDDFIQGLGGNDKIVAGEGNNVIDAGSGNNKISSGAGDDHITAGAGNDKVSAGDGDNRISVGGGNNNVAAGAGDDTLSAGSGNDKMAAGEGNNAIDAGEGNNALTAGGGNDTISSGAGNDKIAAGAGDNVIDAGDGANSVTTLNGSDHIATGSGKDKISAGDGANVIVSGGDVDKISTGTGNDVIDAGGGNDKVMAGAGDDLIRGGQGADKLTGGPGGDTFILDNLADGGFDSITDFAEEDILQLDLSTFSALTGETAGTFTTNMASTGVDLHLIYNIAKGALYYDADGAGLGNAALQIASVKGAAAKTLSFDDFVLA